MPERCKPNCDMDNPVKKGRATWCCPDCGRDYSLEYVLYQEALDDSTPTQTFNNQRKQRHG